MLFSLNFNIKFNYDLQDIFNFVKKIFHLMKETDGKIIGITFSVEFESLFIFIRSFKSEKGKTPGEYNTGKV